MDLLAKLPEMVEIKVVNSKSGDAKVEHIKIQYDYLLIYYKICKLKGNGEDEYQTLHPELKREFEVRDKEKQNH